MSQSFRSAAVAVLSAGGLAALGCAATPLAPEAPPQVSPVTLSAGEQRVVDHVFVVTDASGTMYEAKSFPRAKALSQGFVDALPAPDARAASTTYNAGAIGFGGDDRVSLALQSFDRRALRGTVDQVHVMGRVDGRGGETPLHRVIGEIGSQLDGKTGRAAVVVFTDGEPDDSAAALDAATALASSYASGVCYHGVQVGDDPAGARFLQTLSEISSPCGSFRNASAVGTGTALAAFTKGVMVGDAPGGRSLPAVAANACTGVTLNGIEFSFDRAEIRPQSAPILDQAAGQLRACPDVNITIEGHTDQRGSADYNQSLSERRAGAVRDYLVRKGVESGRLQSVGKGESNPLDTSETEAGYQRNRRVELRPR
ncbi:MAG: OmpA family protein [Myxococcota bacterium]|nr:OmpA family protein [Myxococcales bacterium]